MTMNYKMSKDEQEVIIRWDAAHRNATIHADIPSVIRKLDKLVEAFPDHYRCVFDDPHFASKTFEMDASIFRFPRPLSKKARDARRKNLASGRSADHGSDVGVAAYIALIA